MSRPIARIYWIDYYGALLLPYEIGDITRFSNPKKLVSLVDLAPSVYQSVNTMWTGRIRRQGNKRIRWKALIAVARKMLVSIYYVLTRNELYDGQKM